MKKDYLNSYPAQTQRFQAGGPAPAPEQGGGGGAGVSIEEMIMQALQSGDGNMALEVLGMIAQQMGMGGGGGAPAPAPAEGAPMGRYGMKLSKPSADILK